MGKLNYSAYGTYTQVVTNREPVNSGLIASAEIDNSSNCELYLDAELRATFGSNPSAGGHFAMYIIQALDGTNYHDGADESVAPPATAWAGNFPLRAVTTAQKVGLMGVRIPPGKFKLVFQNNSGQSVSTDTMQVYVRLYSENAA